MNSNTIKSEKDVGILGFHLLSCDNYDCVHTLSYLKKILGYVLLSLNDLFPLLYLLDDQDCHYMYSHKTYSYYYLLDNGSHQILMVDFHMSCVGMNFPMKHYLKFLIEFDHH